MESWQRIRHVAWQGVEPLLLIIAVYAPWALDGVPVGSRALLHGLIFLAGVLGLLGRPENASEVLPFQACERRVLWAGGLFLTYVLVSAINARAFAIVGQSDVVFEYRECISWLPHTYDLLSTVVALIKFGYIAILMFVSWKWVRHQCSPEVKSPRTKTLPGGVSRLIWVLSVSGGVMGIEAILQKVSGTNLLLFFYERHYAGHLVENRSSLGPFAYQGNGAQLLNLIWPLTIGQWWIKRRAEWKHSGVVARFGTDHHAILPVCAAVMVGAILASSSRGGIAVCILEVFAVLGYAMFADRNIPTRIRLGLASLIVAAVGVSAITGWDVALEKLLKTRKDQMGGRLEIYATARRMIPDFEPWGCGAEAAAAVSSLYSPPGENDGRNGFNKVHNDWLEARLSYGIFGYSLLLLFAGCWLLVWMSSIPKIGGTQNTYFMVISLMGLLIHAKFDMPFQNFHLHVVIAIVGTVAAYLPSPILPFVRALSDLPKLWSRQTGTRVFQ